VTRVEPITGQSPALLPLSAAAEEALRRWVFSPGKRDSKPVPSEAVIRFVFRSSGK
jgi:hypothetical protein